MAGFLETPTAWEYLQVERKTMSHVLKCLVNEGSDWDAGQIKMTMLKRSGVFPKNWRRNNLEGVLENKKGDLFFSQP